MRTRNRYEVVKAAGVKFKVRQYDPARDGKDPAAFVRSKNDRRRHYTVAQKRKLLGESIKANSGKSDRQHAAAAGAHHNTATQVRRELESTGEIAGSRESVGADGGRASTQRPVRACSRGPDFSINPGGRRKYRQRCPRARKCVIACVRVKTSLGDSLANLRGKYSP